MKKPHRPSGKLSGPAFAEAERRVASAIKTSATELDLSIVGLTYIPPLASLTALQSLDLSRTRVLDFAPLADLTALQLLKLSGSQISNLAPLAGLATLQSLNLSDSAISNLAPLAGLAALRSLNLSFTRVSDLTPLAGLIGLLSLDLTDTLVTDLAPLAGLTSLQLLNLRNSEVSDLTPLAGLTTLLSLNLRGSDVLDLAPLAGLTELQSLDLGGSEVSDLAPLVNLTKLQWLNLGGCQVSDLAPLAGLTTLIDGAKQRHGLWFDNAPLKDGRLLAFAALDNPERTIKAINYLRQQQGLEPYESKEALALPTLPYEGGEEEEDDLPNAVEDVPAPFDFHVTARGTITVAGSDTNLPAFPFATSREDHARRLESCKVSSGDLIDALSAQRYHNVRQEYLAYLKRYQERLPQSAKDGNMLLADGVARSLSKLFSAEAVILPDAFAAELHTLLEQHIATCAYYPEIGTFNRDVRDGKPSRPFPLMAAEALVQAVQAHTPSAFEPSVSRAFSEVQVSPPLPPMVPADLLPNSPQTILPPPIPGGETDPRKSQEFAKASTANRLWKVVKAMATVSGASHGVIDASKALAPHVKEMIDWLSDIIASLG